MSERVDMRLSFAVWLFVAGCGAAGGRVESADAARRVEVSVPAFSALDADGDHRLIEVELVRAALAYHGAWDLDEDGLVADGELSLGLFAMLDRDRSELVSAEELARHARMVLPPEARDLSHWDENRDGSIDRRELRVGLEALGVIAALDANEDGIITDLEVAATLLAHLDTNGDGAVDLAEWREAGGNPG